MHAPSWSSSSSWPSIEVGLDSPDDICPRSAEVTRLEGSPRSLGTCALGTADVEFVEPSAMEDPLVGTVVADRYRVLARIGSGGIGHVYKVEHTSIGKLLAMKLLAGAHARDATMDWRFRREARAVSKLESPNTVQVFDFGVSGGSSYLVMELVRGETLSAVLARSGPLAPARVLKIAIQICSSLSEAHAAGIVHRDIKPDNVMIVRAADGSDIVKVVDFGLAKLDAAIPGCAANEDHRTRDARPASPATSPVASEVTSRGTVLGTPHYMAPEQILGEPVDARADLYALGGLLYRVLSGHFPFEGKPVDILRRSLVESPLPLAHHDPSGRIPPQVSAIVERCLERAPDRRFESASALRAALVSALRELTGTSSVQRLLDPRWVARAARSSDAPCATRDDVDAYERRLKRRRTSVQALLFAAVGATSVGLGWAYQSRASTAERVEREPNDDPDSATRVALGQSVEAQIGKRIDPEHGDRDHFVFDVREREPLRIAVRALPNMPLCAVLYRSGLLEPVGRWCALPGVDLDAQTVPLPEGRYLVVVLQDMSPVDGKTPFVVENVSDEYTLTVTEGR
ncbi:MAG: serine/threonine-protein kinase [Polyangiaceae bacterium]